MKTRINHVFHSVPTGHNDSRNFIIQCPHQRCTDEERDYWLNCMHIDKHEGPHKDITGTEWIDG
jgi:hypothetical protein